MGMWGCLEAVEGTGSGTWGAVGRGSVAPEGWDKGESSPSAHEHSSHSTPP